MKQEYLECGKIASTHGVKGAVKIDSWCDSPKELAALPRVFLRMPDGAFSEQTIKNPSIKGEQVIAYIGSCASMDEAMLLRGKTVYAKREDLCLPEGRVFLADLAGLPVIDAKSGRTYGTLLEVVPSPSAALLRIKTAGSDVYLPDIPVFVAKKDPEVGIFITPIEGFFEDSGDEV